MVYSRSVLRGSTAHKFLAVFVLAFGCLNAVGALCVAYCSDWANSTAASVTDESHLSEHCKRIKRDAEERSKGSSSIEAAEAACCMLPTALFAAPLEDRQSDVKFVAVPVAVAPDVPITSRRAVAKEPADLPVYRPPPIDRRGERLFHGVIRI